MARAARRMRSRFGGSLEIGTEVELTFFEKESRELVKLISSEIFSSPDCRGPFGSPRSSEPPICFENFENFQPHPQPPMTHST